LIGKLILGVKVMLVNVVYQNGKYGLVEDSELDELIEKRKIKKFLRSTGWCTLGVDPIRKEPCFDYKGQERRQAVKKVILVK
jgi:hypothetical protein